MSIYYELFTLLHQYIYGMADLTPDMSLTLTLCATIGSLFLVALPFMVVWRVIRFIMR